jgi:hypothetical protein
MFRRTTNRLPRARFSIIVTLNDSTLLGGTPFQPPVTSTGSVDNPGGVAFNNDFRSDAGQDVVQTRPPTCGRGVQLAGIVLDR